MSLKKPFLWTYSAGRKTFVSFHTAIQAAKAGDQVSPNPLTFTPEEIGIFILTGFLPEKGLSERKERKENKAFLKALSEVEETSVESRFFISLNLGDKVEITDSKTGETRVVSKSSAFSRDWEEFFLPKEKEKKTKKETPQEWAERMLREKRKGNKNAS
jgi:hypothetical protein